MPFVHAISPVIVSLGPFAIRWYSLVYVLGFLLAYWLLVRAARKGALKNVTVEDAEEYLIWLIVGSVAVARLLYVLVYNPAFYFVQPWKVLFLWEGGLSFHGGLLGAVLATLWFTKRRKISFYALADLLVTPFALVLVFGRIANFVNGELVGRVTDVAWCVTYPDVPGVDGCRHPSQFYEAGKNLAIFAVLLGLTLNKKLKAWLREGTLFWLFVLLYGVGRFLTNFFRAPDLGDPVFLGLILGQWLSLLMVAVALPATIFFLNTSGKKDGTNTGKGGTRTTRKKSGKEKNQ